MPHSSPAFSPSEYNRRLYEVRKAMAERGLDALFVEDPSNMAWITGYEGWSFYVHQGVIVTPDEDPIWWGRNQDANGAYLTVWMGNDQVVGYPDNYVQSTERHPMQHLAHLLSDMGLEGRKIGVEMENYYFSAKAYTTLLESLPGTDIIDATALVNWCRLVKSGEEIVTMRRAARIVEKTMDRVIDRVVPGMRKNDLVAEIYGDLIRGAEGAWGDYPAIVPLLPSGVNAAAPHLTWDGAPFLVGEATFFEMAGCVRRYHVPFCRTVFLGKPPDYMRRAEAALIEGLEAGLEMARAGNRACDVANALAAPLEAAGLERGARCGYPIGLSYPPDWGERTVSLRPEDETVLEPNMTFHFMPGLWMDDWGMEITETIRITEDGAPECFCDRPRKLFVKD